jgi:transaldolase
MKEGYFKRVAKLTPTKFWINNPTREETKMAIEEGAVGCTCNPAYCGKMLDKPEEKDTVIQVIDRLIPTLESDNEVEEELQRILVGEIAKQFMPLYEQNPGELGYVSIQGDPIHEDDPEVIIQEARKNRAVSPNMCIKIPTTESGLEAMKVLVAEDTPLNATEVFAIQQALDLCELYESVSKETGKHPKFYISHITGIYDEHLKNVVERDKIDISADILWQGGLSIARKLYNIFIERGYPVTFIGGGARGLQHFTEMVGGDVCITINWVGTADKLLEQDPPVVERLFNPVPQYVIDELMEKIPDYRRGYLEGGIEKKEYEDFGPVVLFRNSFIKNWEKVLNIIHEKRTRN